MSEDTRTLRERKLAVMAGVGKIPKSGVMEIKGKRTKYVATDDMLTHLRPIFEREELTLTIDVKEVRKGIGATVGILYELTLSCPVDAETVTIYGEGALSSSARTYAVKDWLKGTFLIGGESDAAEKMDRELTEKRERQSGQKDHPAAARREDRETGREAPAKSYEEDEARKNLRVRVAGALMDWFAVPAVDESGSVVPGQFDRKATQAEVERQLLGLHAANPDAVALNEKGKPDLRLCSNGQLAQIEAWVKSLSAPAEDLFGDVSL